MKSKQDRRSQPRPEKLRRRKPAELAALQQMALAWRAAWRDEVAASNRGDARTMSATPLRSRDDAAQRARFAAAIARAEFGRHYWDARKDSAPKRPARRNRANGKAPT